MKLHETLNSGYVRRWHTHPFMSECGENLAAHQWGVAAIAIWLEPDISRDGLMLALFHDVGEALTGDLKGPFVAAYPAETAPIKAREQAHMEDLTGGVFGVSEWEQNVVHVADKMHGYLTLYRYRPVECTAAERAKIIHIAENALGASVGHIVSRVLPHA